MSDHSKGKKESKAEIDSKVLSSGIQADKD